jgi:hypothetical protein
MTRTTDAVMRVDMLITQAEWFAGALQVEEAIARAKQAIAYAEREMLRSSDSRVLLALDQRIVIAESFLHQMGVRTRDRGGRLYIQPEDAKLPETWT